MNPEAIPAELLQGDQFVNWRYIVRDGKKTKEPMQPLHPNARASSTNPNTWASFSAAQRAAGNAHLDGIGRVVTKADPFVGIDIDEAVLANDSLSKTASRIVNRFDSYTEVSPSGTGLRIWVKGALPGRGRKNGNLEIYDDSRYLTLTGRCLATSPKEVRENQEAIDWLMENFFPTTEQTLHDPVKPRPVPLDDRDLLDRMFASKTGAEIQSLWAGDLGKNPSFSERDLSLCNYLAWWCGGDSTRVDAMFRSSGCFRDKWDQSHGESTYGELTIAKAIAGLSSVYDPNSATTSLPPKGGERDSESQPPPQAERGPIPFAPLPDALANVDPEPDWNIDGLVGPGVITLFSAAPKVGKSVGIFAQIAAMTGGTPFLGRNARPTKALILSEERGNTLEEKRQQWGLDADTHLLMRHQAFGFTWNEVMEAAILYCTKNDIGVLIVDTLGSWWGIDADKENDAPSVTAHLSPVIKAAGEGLGVILSVHARKAGGEHGSGVRGSSALTASVDIIIEVDRVPENDRQRVFRATSRFSSTPTEIVGEWTMGGYEARGDQTSAARRTRDEAIMRSFGDTTRFPLSLAQVRARYMKANGREAPSEAALRGYLDLLADEGRLLAKRGRPHTWEVT